MHGIPGERRSRIGFTELRDLRAVHRDGRTAWSRPFCFE
jgi:hypothetical protein